MIGDEKHQAATSVGDKDNYSSDKKEADQIDHAQLPVYNDEEDHKGELHLDTAVSNLGSLPLFLSLLFKQFSTA